MSEVSVKLYAKSCMKYSTCMSVPPGNCNVDITIYSNSANSSLAILSNLHSFSAVSTHQLRQTCRSLVARWLFVNGVKDENSRRRSHLPADFTCTCEHAHCMCNFSTTYVTILRLALNTKFKYVPIVMELNNIFKNGFLQVLWGFL